MLFSMPELSGLELRVTDIATNAELLAAYGEQIPVLQLCSLGTEQPAEPTVLVELNWPFSPTAVLDALRSQQPTM